MFEQWKLQVDLELTNFYSLTSDNPIKTYPEDFLLNTKMSGPGAEGKEKERARPPCGGDVKGLT